MLDRIKADQDQVNEQTAPLANLRTTFKDPAYLASGSG